MCKVSGILSRWLEVQMRRDTTSYLFLFDYDLVVPFASLYTNSYIFLTDKVSSGMSLKQKDAVCENSKVL